MRKLIPAYFIIFILGFIYLSFYALVSLDEVMLLDPCRNLLQGNYISKLWYAQGTENHFMAYLPANSFFRLIFLPFLPDTLFFHRLPFILAFGFASWLIYKITRFGGHDPIIGLLTVILFVNDKGLWDTTLSGRSEILEVLFILIYFYPIKHEKIFLHSAVKGLAVAGLFLCHPPVWIIVLILMALLYRDKSRRSFLISSIAFLLPILLYLILIHFDIRELSSQLFNNGNLLRPTEDFLFRLQHFYSRFLPYPYIYQPWVILLLLASIGYIVNFRTYREKLVFQLGIVLIAYFLTLVFISGNYYRYNPPLLLCIYLLFPYIMKYFREKYNIKIKKGLAVIVVLIVTIPFAARVIKTFEHQNATNTSLLIQQFKSLVEDKPVAQYSLIIGEPIGYYFASACSGVDYSTPFSLNKFDLKDYQNIYLLSYDKKAMPGYKLIDELMPGEIEDGTYRGLKLFALEVK